jgi:hypothetical protein
MATLIWLTLVVVPAVGAVLLEVDAAVLAVPAVVAPALPLRVPVDLALAVAGAGVRAALHRAVAPVPAGHAEAGAVLALAVLVAPGVALLQVAELAGPAGQAVAGVVDAVSVGAAVLVAELCERADGSPVLDGWTERRAGLIDESQRLPFEQSSPDHMGSHRHVWVSRSKLPWPLQPGRHWRASLSVWLQSVPFQPFLHMQVPSAQKPCPEQVGCGQSTSSQNLPL